MSRFTKKLIAVSVVGVVIAISAINTKYEELGAMVGGLIVFLYIALGLWWGESGTIKYRIRHSRNWKWLESVLDKVWRE